MLKENLNHTSNKGITLIALIITIIVMLILVAVTITTAINGGLFEKAGEAVGEMQNAVNKEQELANGKIEIGGVLYDSIDDYLNNTPSALHNWTRTGDTFTCSHCNTTYEMGQVVNYTPDKPTSKTGKLESVKVASTNKILAVTAAPSKTATISAQMSGLDKYYAKNSSYPSYANVDANGTQTIEAQESAWIVLGIEDTDGDKIYETLLITTESYVLATTDKPLCFYGAAAYNNGPREINRVCEELYSNSEYGKARGMTIEDVNTALNYTPHGGEYYDTSDSTVKTTGNLTTKLKGIPTWDNIKGNYQTPDGTNTEAALGNYELNGYYYYLNEDANGLINDVNDTTTSITEVEKNTIFGPSKNYIYWLASRGVYADSVCAIFGPGRVGRGDVYSYFDLFVSDGDENGGGAGLRPVVSLKSKLPTVISDGSEEK